MNLGKLLQVVFVLGKSYGNQLRMLDQSRTNFSRISYTAPAQLINLLPIFLETVGACKFMGAYRFGGAISELCLDAFPFSKQKENGVIFVSVYKIHLSYFLYSAGERYHLINSKNPLHFGGIRPDTKSSC